MNYKVFLLICLSIVWKSVFSQISEPIPPYSFQYTVPGKIQTINMPPLKVDSLLMQDKQQDRVRPYRFGYEFDVSYDNFNVGTWMDLPNGGKLWRLRIVSPGAYSINLIYKKFWLPKGATFHIYNQDKSMVLGAFTSRNNKPHGKFATDLVKGSVVILEYYEPPDVNDPGIIHISKVVHGYRNLFGLDSGLSKTQDFGDSGGCNNNVDCPEWDAWYPGEVHSVDMVVAGGNRLCSGALVNNVREDYTPYFLIAQHCIYSEDPNTFIFWFNYESSTCDDPIQPPGHQSVSGSHLVASNMASDFALLKLDNTPPLTCLPYYAGWSNAGDTPSSTVGIHHPSGDIKKISLDSDPATSSEWTGTPLNSHWEVYFDDGTTEYGSSGSPLFNQNHKIIGQLHGNLDPNFNGYNFCDVPHAWYGKFSVSWDYGSTQNTRLKDWLDPDNTGATSINTIPPPGLLVPENYSTISSALAAANSGDSVVVMNGTYSESTNLTIPSGVSLFMLQGGTLRMANNTQIVVNGTFNAVDATFTASNSSWDGIRFNSGSDGMIRDCNLYKGGGSYYIYAYNSSPSIRDNLLDQEAGVYYGIKAYGSGAAPHLWSNEINVFANGVDFSGAAEGAFDFNTVNLTNTYGYGYPLQLGGDAWVTADINGGNALVDGEVGAYVSNARLDMDGDNFTNTWCNANYYDLSAVNSAVIDADYNDFPGASPRTYRDGTSVINARYAGYASCYGYSKPVAAGGAAAPGTRHSVHSLALAGTPSVLAQGWTALRSGDDVQAKQCFESVLSTAADTSVAAHSAIRGLAHTLTATHDPEILHRIQTLAKQPGPLQAHAQLVVVHGYQVLGDQAAALAAAQTWYQEHPKAPEAFAGREAAMYLLWELGRPQEAVGVLAQTHPRTGQETADLRILHDILQQAGADVPSLASLGLQPPPELTTTTAPWNQAVTVVPNPYDLSAARQDPAWQLQFVHLPAQARIQIYDVAGARVQTFTHQAGADPAGFGVLEVPAGVYLYVVEELDVAGGTPTGKQATGKFVVIP